MKRVLVSILCCLFVFCSTIPAYASTSEVSNSVKTVTEYFEDGSYVITKLEVVPSMARTAKTYTKTSTYYTSSNKAIFSVSLTGNFSYTYNVSSTATGQSVSVSIHDSSASYVTRTSSRSGATVYGSGTVSYAGRNKTLSVSITCDKYGNVS